MCIPYGFRGRWRSFHRIANLNLTTKITNRGNQTVVDCGDGVRLLLHHTAPQNMASREIAPGKVAILKGELEEELPGWKIMVGPPEAMDVGGYLKQNWPA